MQGPVVFLVDSERNSYAAAGDLYAAAFRHIGLEVITLPYPSPEENGAMYSGECRNRIVVHHTIGPLFRRIDGALNVAVVFHEWDRYPARWLRVLNSFNQIWAPSEHVRETLERSGLSAPLLLAAPPLDVHPHPEKTTWEVTRPFRFLSVGEAHFRKAFHLLFAAFEMAFPEADEATLLIKTSPDCAWESPRSDISILPSALPRDRMAELYASSDAYITASLGEGLGLPIAEAILALLPVCANLWGGHRRLLSEGSFWRIPHEEIIQPFASQPSYYAPDQRCAYSTPTAIADAMRQVVAAHPGLRRDRATRARAHLRQRHGLTQVASAIEVALRELRAA